MTTTSSSTTTRTTTATATTTTRSTASSESTATTSIPKSDNSNRHLALLIWAGILLVRIWVGYQPHSGQDNYHGRRGSASYGGDFEAQRHWMEITWNLPISEWYTHDLEYWGLDYPPLSAFQSWLCGALSHMLAGPETVALHTSRYGALEGHPTHKAFMRATVLALDLVFYATAVYYISMTTMTTTSSSSVLPGYVSLVTALLQPALLLIDHGHFQYNTVALGLALWSFALASTTSTTSSNSTSKSTTTSPAPTQQPLSWNDIAACVSFVCALSFKQMTLYYAPAIFAYLLGKCCSGTNFTSFVRRFVCYGLTVIATFVVIWWPFLTTWYVVVEEEDSGRAHGNRWLLWQVLHRIFPLHRGLFEDKVANVWFVLSLRPLRLTERIPQVYQPLAALALTLCLMLPACGCLFQLGKRCNHYPRQQQLQVLLLGASSTALSLFLGAFHVHEKSILLALSPASLVLQPDLFLDWFALVATWSLWPLLVLDRLQVAYFCTIVIYLCSRRIMAVFADVVEHDPQNTEQTASTNIREFPKWLQYMILLGASMVMIGLHVLEVAVTPPPHFPHLFAVLWSIAGCAFYLVVWLGMVWQLYFVHDLEAMAAPQVKEERRPKID
ncbi:hypothetical protein ACA910_019650 [Epithemia clementina (nom. ined.)]